MHRQLKGSIMLLLTALIWGTNFVAQSLGMNYVEPFTYNAMRSLLGGAVLLPVIAGFKAFDKKKTSQKAPFKVTLPGGILCGLALFVASSLQQYGITMTTAGKAGFITALYIVIVPLLGMITGKKPPVTIWLCVAVAITGFYLLCINEGFSVGKGDMAVLLCAFCFAVHIMVIDRFNSLGADGVVMSCLQFFTAGILMLICMFIFEEPKAEEIKAAYGAIAYGGITSCGIAYTLQIIGQRYTEPTLATMLMSLESVFAALSGWLILNEHLSLKEFFGCMLVFAAVISAQLFTRDKVTQKSQDKLFT